MEKIDCLSRQFDSNRIAFIAFELNGWKMRDLVPEGDKKVFGLNQWRKNLNLIGGKWIWTETRKIIRATSNKIKNFSVWRWACVRHLNSNERIWGKSVKNKTKHRSNRQC